MAEHKITAIMPSINHLQVRIDGVTHLTLPNQKLGWMSYIGKDATKWNGARYFIEFSWDGGGITADYDERPIWEGILQLLDSFIRRP